MEKLAKKWQKKLLEGIDELPRGSAWPAAILLIGEEVTGIIHGQNRWEVILAARTYGNGKIFAASHEMYTYKFGRTDDNANIRQLHSNIRAWMGAEKNAICDLKNIDENSDLAGVNIIYWDGRTVIETDSNFEQKIETFIQDGGGLVYGICYWGFLQLHPNTNLPLHNLLAKIGIGFSDVIPHPQPSVFKATERPEYGKTNLCALLQGFKCDDSNNDVEEIFHALRFALTYASDIAMLRHQKLMRAIWNKKDASKFPSKESPLTFLKDKMAYIIMHLMMEKNWLGEMACPAVANFPYNVKIDDPYNLDKSVYINIKTCGKRVHPTGHYLRPGKAINVTLQTSTKENTAWTIRIGAHSDTTYDPYYKEYKRCPNIVVTEEISSKENSVRLFSAHGGCVYLHKHNEEDPQESVDFFLENVIEAPYFNLSDLKDGDDGETKWLERRLAPGPWADFVGRHVVVTLPSSSVREIKGVAKVLEAYDELLRNYAYLRGVRADLHHQWIVADMQLFGGGYMHAGYPIMTHLDVANPSEKLFLMSYESLKKYGSWGIFHEIGHNLQYHMWTWDGMGEVSTNIFTLYGMETMTCQDPWIHSWLEAQKGAAIQYLHDRAVYSQWQSNPGIGLFVFAQLAHYFDWGMYMVVFRQYEEDLNEGNEVSNMSNDQKVYLWITRCSLASNHDLRPLFHFWGLPVQDEKLEEIVTNLTPFLPLDEITCAVRDRFDNITAKYKGCVSSITNKPHYPKYEHDTENPAPCLTCCN